MFYYSIFEDLSVRAVSSSIVTHPPVCPSVLQSIHSSIHPSDPLLIPAPSVVQILPRIYTYSPARPSPSHTATRHRTTPPSKGPLANYKTGRMLINKLEHVCFCKQMIQQRFSVLSSVTWRFNPLSRRVGLFCFGFISPCLPCAASRMAT